MAVEGPRRPCFPLGVCRSSCINALTQSRILTTMTSMCGSSLGGFRTSNIEFGVAEQRCARSSLYFYPRVHVMRYRFACLIAIFFVVFAWIFLASAELKRLTPPETATNIRSFAECMPKPQRVARINDAGKTRIVWIGDTASWALPSGPSCYIFDASGKLIEWNATTGDGEPTTRYLQQAYQSPPMTVQDASGYGTGTFEN